MYCTKCGKELPGDAAFCPSCGTTSNGQKAPRAHPHNPVKGTFPFWKLLSGVVSMIFAFYIIAQSAKLYVAEYIVEMLTEIFAEGAAPSASYAVTCMITGVLMLVSGVVSVAIYRGGKVENAVLLVLYCIPAIVGFTVPSNYSDLYIAAAWCIVCAIGALISLIMVRDDFNNKMADKPSAPTPDTSEAIQVVEIVPDVLPETEVESNTVASCDAEPTGPKVQQAAKPRRSIFLGILLGSVVVILALILAVTFATVILPILTK